MKFKIKTLALFPREDLTSFLSILLHSRVLWTEFKLTLTHLKTFFFYEPIYAKASAIRLWPRNLETCLWNKILFAIPSSRDALLAPFLFAALSWVCGPLFLKRLNHPPARAEKSFLDAIPHLFFICFQRYWFSFPGQLCNFGREA